MAGKKKALGRGLSILLEGSDLEEAPKEVQRKQLVGSVALIPIEDIETNPFQPRTDFDPEELANLALSIQNQGIIQPLTVRKLDVDRFQLISGERRLKAARVAGLIEVPVYIRVANDEQMLEMALVENIQRTDLNPVEIAISYQRLLEECQIRQEELSQRVGKDRSTISNYIRLLKLPAEIQLEIREKRLSMGHARALITLVDPHIQIAVMREILEQNLSVREVEKLVRKKTTGTTQKPKSKSKTEPEHLFNIEASLLEKYHTPVSVTMKHSGSGSIVMPFKNKEELNRLLELLDS
jgi:ParB family transcriptional regulator, chromosome partitioning protein